MPSEAQLKAQMQAAILKKKQEEAKKEEKAPAKEDPAKTEEKPAAETASTAAAVVQVASEAAPPEQVSAQAPPPAPPPDVTAFPSSVFYGHEIRFTVSHHNVYFAVTDALPVAMDPESNFKYLELRNNPKTKDEVLPRIKTLTFLGKNGPEKLDGARTEDLLYILHKCELLIPGPFGRWLENLTEQHKNDDVDGHSKEN